MPKRAWALLALLFLLRFVHWGAPMIGDEAFMARTYADKPLAYSATQYQTTNNHVLLSMLLHGIDAISPRKLLVTLAHPGPLQALSILSSIAALCFFALMAFEAFSAMTAWFAVVLYGGAYWQLLYGHMLRGYALSGLLLLSAAWALWKFIQEEKTGPLLAAGVFMAAAHYTTPSNAYFTAALGVWALLNSWNRLQARMKLSAVLFAAAVATSALYWPLLGQISAAARHLAGSTENPAGMRWAAQFGVFGFNFPFRVFFAVLAAVGAREAWLQRKDPAASMLLCVAVLPFFFVTLHGQAPFIRHFLPGLPAWCLLAAWGLTAALRPFGKKLPAAAGWALLLACVNPEVKAFVSWNSGHDLRGAFTRVVESVRHEDDFLVVYAVEQKDPQPEAFSWEYYAFAADMAPGQKVFASELPISLRARKVTILAENQAAAQAAAQRSGFAPEECAAMTLSSSAGSIQLWEISTPEGSAPKGPVARAYFDAWARYLAFDDEAAVRGLAGVAGQDPRNVAAPYYLADALASLGRFEEAERALDYYRLGASGVSGAYAYEKRIAALSAGIREVRLHRGAKTAPQWDQASEQCMRLGLYERALAAQGRGEALAPSVARRVRSVEALRALKRYAESTLRMESLLAVDSGSGVWFAIAESRHHKFDARGATAAVEEVLKRSPGEPRALELSRRIRRGEL